MQQSTLCEHSFEAALLVIMRGQLAEGEVVRSRLQAQGGSLEAVIFLIICVLLTLHVAARRCCRRRAASPGRRPSVLRGCATAAAGSCWPARALASCWSCSGEACALEI